MAYNNIKVKERQTVSQSSQTKQLGIVSEVPMNEWNAEISYEKLNLVTYKNGTFIAKRKNKGIAPLDTMGWKDVWMPLLSGIGISSTVVEYATASVTLSTPPQNGWGTEIPAFEASELLWTRMTITYTDGTKTAFYSVGVTVAPTKTSELQNDGNGLSPFATEAFTNSSINNLAAFYITYNAQDDAFPTKAALTGATTFYNDKKPRVPTTNDYAIVRADESQPKNVDGSYPTTRYIYQGGTYPEGSWSFQWVINNTPFTQAQVDALNSGITTAKVAQIEQNKLMIEAAQTEFVKKTGDTINGNLIISGEIFTETNQKLYGMRRLEVDLTNDNPDTWYPVMFRIASGAARIIFYSIFEDGNTAPWSTHPSKIFSYWVDWTVIPDGWGGNNQQRTINKYSWNLCDSPFGRIEQLYTYSGEYIYCRGGAKYIVYVSTNVEDPQILREPYSYGGSTSGGPTKDYESIHSWDNTSIIMQSNVYANSILANSVNANGFGTTNKDYFEFTPKDGGTWGARGESGRIYNLQDFYAPSNPPPVGSTGTNHFITLSWDAEDTDGTLGEIYLPSITSSNDEPFQINDLSNMFGTYYTGACGYLMDSSGEECPVVGVRFYNGMINIDYIRGSSRRTLNRYIDQMGINDHMSPA